MKEYRENPDGAANQQATRENESYVGGLKLQESQSPVSYRGLRTEGIVAVYRQQGGKVQTFDTRPSLEVACHSPVGFEWGYQGSGPAQLALAILLDAAGTVDSHSAKFDAERMHQDFKREVVTFMPHYNWTLQASDVLGWMNGNLGADHFRKLWAPEAA